MSGVQLHGVCKRYGSTMVVDNLHLEVAKGEMVALLGPSGCGKTTTLRMVAGFVPPSDGRITTSGADITGIPPNRRNIGLVFQNYALFPHLSVFKNIAFGLKRRGVGAAEIRRRVAEMIQLTRLEGLERRLPRELSGGQQQRVAVARALVINPAVLLLDEPFSNLDAKLRESTSHELRRIQSGLGITSIFVTHDQQEAMAIADRVAVMNAGRIEQIGTGPELYRHPATKFVASFLGKANFFDVEVANSSGGSAGVVLAGTALEVPTRSAAARPGSHASLMIRPEFVEIADVSEPGIPAKIIEATFQGSYTILRLALQDEAILTVECSGKTHERFAIGASVSCQIDAANAVLFGSDGAAL